jgi:ferric-dicitrate binding protein FerR (iron transport regulator)
MINVSDFQEQSESDRDWLAFRYIAGELSATEGAAFEAELESSQAAREAVARAVELSQVVTLAESQEVELVESASRNVGRRKSLVYGLGWFGAGAVAASVAGFVWWNSQAPKSGTSELAEIWTQSRAIEPSVPDVSTIEHSPVLDSAEPATAPSWMMAGVISQGGGKVDDVDGDGKPDETWDDEVLEN